MNLKNMQLFRQISSKRCFDVGFLFLLQALIINSYFNLHRDQANIWASLLFPVFSYLIGLYFSDSKKLIAVVTAIVSIAGIVYIVKANNEKEVILFFIIPLIAVILALIEDRSKLNQWLVAAVYVVAAVGYLIVKDGLAIRIKAIIQAISLLKKNEFGGFVMDVFPGNTSSTMWLDYARDYGIFPFVCLAMFALISLILLIKLLLKKEKNFTTYALINLYVFLNMYYMLYSTARIHVYMWAVGLMVCGMIRGYINEKTER